MTIDLLKCLTKLNIQDFEFEDLKNIGDLSGYDFSIIKLKVSVINENLSSIKIDEMESVDVYLKMIRKDRIKESIFCYWNLLYEEKFKNYEESEFTSVINKVRITETENEEYMHSVLLHIKDNKWETLKNGSTIHLVKLEKYLNDNTIRKSILIKEWKKHIEEGNQDVLFIGVVNN